MSGINANENINKFFFFFTITTTTVRCGLWLPIQFSSIRDGLVPSSQQICFYGIGMSTQCPTANLEDRGVSLGLEPHS
jgi:hypothetical protein